MMDNKKQKKLSKTQHSAIYYKKPGNTKFNGLDNPDDRMTNQTGDGLTIVKNDNPDDIEDKI